MLFLLFFSELKSFEGGNVGKLLDGAAAATATFDTNFLKRQSLLKAPMAKLDWDCIGETRLGNWPLGKNLPFEKQMLLRFGGNLFKKISTI